MKSLIARFGIGLLLCSSAGASENLLDIYSLALQNDPTLQAAAAQSEAGRTLNRQALARLLPTLEANYQRSVDDSKTESIGRTGVIEGTVRNFDDRRDTEEDRETYSITLTQDIFNAQAIFGYRQVKASSKQSLVNYELEKQQLIVRTSEAYFDILRASNNLSSARAEEKAIAQQLEQTQQRYEAGLVAITDVHEAQAAYDLAVANRLNEEVQLGITNEALSSITGQHHASLSAPRNDFPIVQPTPNNIDQWVEFATRNNQSIKLAELVLKAANENAHVKSSAFLPTVRAIGSYNKSNGTAEIFDIASSSTLPDSRSLSEGSRIELSISLPLYTGGSRFAERKQAGYERVAEQANLVATKRRALQDTRSSYLTTTTAIARVKANARATVSANSALEATQAGYDAGTRNIVDLLNAQRDLYRAERDYANSRYDYIINSLQLKLAAGTISDKDVEDINRWLN